MNNDTTNIVLITTILTALSGIVLALINMRGQSQIQAKQLQAQQALEANRTEVAREHSGMEDAQQMRQELRAEIGDLRIDNQRLRRENDACLRNQIYLEGRLMNAETEINVLRIRQGMPEKPVEESQIRMPAPQEIDARDILRQRNEDRRQQGQPLVAPPEELEGERMS